MPKEIRKLGGIIEEEDTVIAILREKNAELHQELDNSDMKALRRRVVVIQKDNGDAYPYLAICDQQDYAVQKIRNKLQITPVGR